jgi:hypothetical protein
MEAIALSRSEEVGVLLAGNPHVMPPP